MPMYICGPFRQQPVFKQNHQLLFQAQYVLKYSCMSKEGFHFSGVGGKLKKKVYNYFQWNNPQAYSVYAGGEDVD